MRDLLYMVSSEDYQRLQRQLHRLYPDMVFEDASDDLHPRRFRAVGSVPIDEWFLVVFVNGFADCSLEWQLCFFEDPITAGKVLNTALRYLRSKNAGQSAT